MGVGTFLLILLGIVSLIVNYIYVTHLFFEYRFDTRKEVFLHLIPFAGFWTLAKEIYEVTIEPVWKDLEK